MRRPVDAERLRRFMQALGPEAEKDLRLYFTGGATAVLFGWRASTVDIDLKLEPDSDRVLRALPRLKESLEVNIELAAPDQFIPEVPGWQDRSIYIARETVFVASLGVLYSAAWLYVYYRSAWSPGGGG